MPRILHCGGRIGVTDRTDELAALISVAGRPIHIAEVAAAFGIDQSEAVDLVEEAAAGGQVADGDDGISVAEGTRAPSPSRKAHMAGVWARALEGTGAATLETGMAFHKANAHREAFGRLLDPALEGGELEVIEAALESGRRSGELAPDTEARLLLARAIRLREVGDSMGASADLEVAVRRLDGVELIDALGFAAAVADDLQDPQRAEVLTAMAAGQAAAIGEIAKLGSILTLQGRTLSRIGFPIEADRTLEVGRALVDEHGSQEQRHRARLNNAWVLIDRGEARVAEIELSRLVDEAKDMDDASLADRKAYWARALFMAGDPSSALDACRHAEDIAKETGAESATFLAGIARLQGAWLYGRSIEGLELSERILTFTMRSLPAWENVIRFWRARHLAAVGRNDDALAEIRLAIDATPAGAAGWRWRIRSRAIEMSLLSAEEAWPQSEAEDLTDTLLQARWYETAAWLLGVRSRRENETELGEQGVALALQIGNPMLAAQVAETAGLWTTTAGGAAARAVQATRNRIPEDWLGDWERFGPASHGLSVEASDDTQVLFTSLDEAFRAAGLAGGEVVLSPAQRRVRGLVRTRKRRRRWPTVAAATLGVVAVSAATALGVGLFNEPAAPGLIAAPATTRASTTTTTMLEQHIIESPEQGLFGRSLHRGGGARTGELTGGVSDPSGIYWAQQLSGPFFHGPIARGQLLYLPTSTPDSMLFLMQGDGSLVEELPVDGRVEAPPVLAENETEGGVEPLIVFTTTEGFMYFHSADKTGRIPERVQLPQGNRAKGSPVVTDEGLVVVATDGGLILAYIPPGLEAWEYPAGTEELGISFEVAPAYRDGIIYAVGSGTDDNSYLFLIESSTGAPLCDSPVNLHGNVSDGVTVTGDLVLVPMLNGTILKYAPGSCGAFPASGVPQITGSFALQLPIAAANGILYQVEGRILIALDYQTGESMWVFPPVVEQGPNFATGPVVANGLVYIGTVDGKLLVFDAAAGELVWQFSMETRPAGPPAIVDGAVYVATVDGRVIAIGEEPTR